MAATKMPKPGTLSLKVQTGTSASGNPVYSTRNYSGVKSDATDQALFDVGTAIAGVVKHPLSEIIRNDKSALVNM